MNSFTTASSTSPSYAFIFGQWRAFSGRVDLTEKGNAKSLYFKAPQNVVIGNIQTQGWGFQPASCISPTLGSFRAVVASAYLFTTKFFTGHESASIVQWAIPADSALPMILWLGNASADTVAVDQRNFVTITGHVNVSCTMDD